jgi:hypothetical protein
VSGSIFSAKEGSRDEPDAAVAARIPVLMQWLKETDVEAYLLDAGVNRAGRPGCA